MGGLGQDLRSVGRLERACKGSGNVIWCHIRTQHRPPTPTLILEKSATSEASMVLVAQSGQGSPRCETVLWVCCAQHQHADAGWQGGA